MIEYVKCPFKFATINRSRLDATAIQDGFLSGLQDNLRNANQADNVS